MGTIQLFLIDLIIILFFFFGFSSICPVSHILIPIILLDYHHRVGRNRWIIYQLIALSQTKMVLHFGVIEFHLLSILQGRLFFCLKMEIFNQVLLELLRFHCYFCEPLIFIYNVDFLGFYSYVLPTILVCLTIMINFFSFMAQFSPHSNFLLYQHLELVLEYFVERVQSEKLELELVM